MWGTPVAGPHTIYVWSETIQSGSSVPHKTFGTTHLTLNELMISKAQTLLECSLQNRNLELRTTFDLTRKKNKPPEIRETPVPPQKKFTVFPLHLDTYNTDLSTYLSNHKLDTNTHAREHTHRKIWCNFARGTHNVKRLHHEKD